MCTEAYLAHVEEQIYELADAATKANMDVTEGGCLVGVIEEGIGFAAVQEALTQHLASVYERQGKKGTQDEIKQLAQDNLMLRFRAITSHLTN